VTDRREDEVRPVVLVPTYDERENIGKILDAVLAQPGDFHVCVIDDASPDGTGQIAQHRADADPRVHVIHRAGKQGLGRAYVAGFRWALAHPSAYTHVLQLDADFSHDPAELPRLLRTCVHGADVVVGSRWIPGAGVRGWPLHRRLISKAGSRYARTVLSVPIRDLTAGYKCFARRVLETIDLDAVAATGYAFQIEMTYRALRQGFVVVEHPIVFVDRTRGKSKMSLPIFIEGALAVLRLRMSGVSP
jgi:dolichol-phosphate mannosyltransferase